MPPSGAAVFSPQAKTTQEMYKRQERQVNICIYIIYKQNGGTGKISYQDPAWQMLGLKIWYWSRIFLHEADMWWVWLYGVNGISLSVINQIIWNVGSHIFEREIVGWNLMQGNWYWRKMQSSGSAVLLCSSWKLIVIYYCLSWTTQHKYMTAHMFTSLKARHS